MHPNHTTNEIPYGYCQCGCGQLAPIATQDRKQYGHIKGQPQRFVRGHTFKRLLEKRFWEKVDRQGPDDCWEWQAGKYGQGYGMLWHNGTMRKAHRISYELHNGPIPDGMKVCHNCPKGDNPSCVNPAHLWLGTTADNNHDRDTKGHQVTQRGAKNYRAKFTDDDVRAIRKRHADGVSLATLGREYGVNKTAIHKVVTRESWRHVT